MIPGLESIPESDFHHFSEINDYDSDSDSEFQFQQKLIFVLHWNRFRVLESIPKSDVYHGYDSDSDSDSNEKRNHTTSSEDHS